MDLEIPLDAAMEMPVEDGCGAVPFAGSLELRVAAIFFILATSLLGTLFPIVSRRVRALRVPDIIFQGTRYFGSGVIIATAFIHLLAPAFGQLGSACLPEAWQDYPYAAGFTMLSVFLIFIVELVATRAGASYLKKRNLRSLDPHSQGSNMRGHSMHGAHIDESVHDVAHPDKKVSGEETPQIYPNSLEEGDVKVHGDDDIHAKNDKLDEDGLSQLIGVAILEFAVMFHSTIIGLTIAVASDAVVLIVVIVFHQTFEGLGLGTRLSLLRLPKKYWWVPFAAALAYSVATPMGIAIGLALRTTYNPESATASIVSGILDALSAGILLYTGLVELLAHDFLYSKEMAVEASNKKVAGSVGMVLLGAGLMALLGRWA